MSSKFIPGIATQSLGAPDKHGLKEKLEAAAAAGMKSIEVFEEDLEILCQQTQEAVTDETRLSCARQIREWCQTYDLDIICLQPFKHFEGLTSEQARQNRLQDLKLWMRIAENLGTDLIQIPSNFLPATQCTGDRATVIADLQTAADMGLANTPTIRFAHEALCWGTHTDHWDEAWEIVEAVNRPNFGTCLDTFNLAGRVYADPTSPTGKTPTADIDIAASIQKLRDTFSDPAKLQKVFYVELCDGERLQSPLDSNHPFYNPDQPSRMSWSRNSRLFPFETEAGSIRSDIGPGYLPILPIFDAILDVGYEGYISFEVFTRTLHEEGYQVVIDHAERARVSWERCAAYIDNYLEKKRVLAAESNEVVDSEHDFASDETEAVSVSVPRIGSAAEFNVYSRL